MFFIFEKLTATHLYIMFPLSLINLMSKVLIFGNGQPKFECQMYFHNEMHNLKHGKKEFLFYRQTNLSMLYFMILSSFSYYTSFYYLFIIWVFICTKQIPIIDSYGCITSLQRHLKRYAFGHYTYVRKIGILSWMGCSILHI